MKACVLEVIAREHNGCFFYHRVVFHLRTQPQREGLKGEPLARIYWYFHIVPDSASYHFKLCGIGLT